MTTFNTLNYASYVRPRNDKGNPLEHYTNVIIKKEAYDILDIEFSPSQRTQYALTLSCGVKIYDAQNSQLVLHLPKLETRVYGATFRQDGQMLAMGEETGDIIVHAPYTKKRLPIRILKGHSKATTWMRFQGQDLCSFSDDTTVRLWDVSTHSQLSSFHGHKKAVRAGSVIDSVPNLILSGSQDNTVLLWDKRQGNSPAFTFQHDCEVSKLLFCPSGNKFVSAGNVFVKFWDIRNHTKLAQCVEHSAPITDLIFSPNKNLVLSAAEDKLVKVFNESSHECVGMKKFVAPVTSLAMAGKFLVVGMSDYCHQLLQGTQENVSENKPEKQKKVFKRKFGMVDESAAEGNEAYLPKLDKLLKNYNYRAAVRIVSNNHTKIYQRLAFFQVLREHNCWKRVAAELRPEDLKPLLQIVNRFRSMLSFHEEVEYAEKSLIEAFKDSPDHKEILRNHLAVASTAKQQLQEQWEASMELQGITNRLLQRT